MRLSRRTLMLLASLGDERAADMAESMRRFGTVVVARDL